MFTAFFSETGFAKTQNGTLVSASATATSSSDISQEDANNIAEM